MSTELFAVNAVSDRIAACPRLSPDISRGDKTPITDGHIDFYSSADKTNKTHTGRVPVQVKGSVTSAKVKASRETQSFQVEREVLQFFRNHGGGLYFYVPMREGGKQRQIFCANLIPFKIDRWLQGKPDTQQSFAVKMTRLPKEDSKIEGIVSLAWRARTQISITGGNADLLDRAESITIHSLAGFDESRPTRLALDETDYLVVASLPGGLEIPIDVDLELPPHEYTERDLAVPITCGGIEFTNGTGRRVSDDTHVLHISAGLELKLSFAKGSINTNLNLRLEGSFQWQAKNVDFVLAAASGNPLIIGDDSARPNDVDLALEAELRAVRSELSRLIELFDVLGIKDDLSSQLRVDVKMKQMLLALHQGLVQDRAVQGNPNGSGRYDIPVGEHKIMVIVMPAEEDGLRRLVDPFDPAKRDQFQMYRFDDDGSPELVEGGTVYESVTPEELANILNIRLHNVVASYQALEDRADAVSKANYMVLRLLHASDLAADMSHRANLFQGTADLCEWLLEEEPDSLVFCINRWQLLYRRGELGETDLREIRTARRGLDLGVEQKAQLEVCLHILLGDTEELELAVAELTDKEIEQLHSWPIWTLTPGKAES
ncbi:MAG: hypothetical protein ACTHW3_08060 [Leucobacter sp.]